MTHPNHATQQASIIATLQAYREALAAGRTAEAERLLVGVAEREPSHPAVLKEIGVAMMSRGEAHKAFSLFCRAAQADPSRASLWSNIASSLRLLGRPQEEREALEKALSLEPRHLPSLLQKASLLEN